MSRRIAALWLAVCAAIATAPACAAQTGDDTPEWRYTLRPGDTLIGVSARYLAQPNDWPKLQRYNGITRPRHLVPGSALRIPLAWMRHEPAPATVVAVTGRVGVRAADALERALRPGEALAAGAVIVAAPDSSATLRFADGSIMVVQPGARVSLDTVSVYAGGGMVDTRVRLQQGRVEIGANPKRVPGSRLQVITPSAVAAVRGTRFRVGADEKLTREETLEGQVGLAAAGREVGVAAGQGTLAEAGKPPRLPVPLLPAPDVSALPATLDKLPMRFALPALAGAAAWVGQIAEDAAFEKLLLERTSATPQLSFGDLPDGRYVLRVRAADAHGLQGRDALHPFELDARPFAPLLTAPGPRVRTPRPDFNWSTVVGADAYRIEIARDAAFEDRVASERTTASNFSPARELAPGTYRWRVASVATDDQGPYSDTQTFTYDPLPAPPELNAAAPVFEQDALTLALPAPRPGLTYELVLARDAERKAIVWQGTSRDGKMRATPVKPEQYYLAARLVEADGTAGPFATRVIEAPPPRFRWEFLLLLLPVLAL